MRREPGSKVGRNSSTAEKGERTGSGIPKVEGTRKILQRCLIFCNGNSTKRWEPPRNGREPGVKSYGMQQVHTLPPPPLPVRHPLSVNRSCQKLNHETKKNLSKLNSLIFSMKRQQHFLFPFLDDCYDVLPQVLCERRKRKGYCSIEGWKDYLQKNCAYTCAFCGK